MYKYKKAVEEVEKKLETWDDKMAIAEQIVRAAFQIKRALEEVEKNLETWDDKMAIAEQIVRAAFQIEAARNAGILIDRIAEDPLSSYMNSRPATKDVGTMVAVKEECPVCTSFIEDIEVSYISA